MSDKKELVAAKPKATKLSSGKFSGTVISAFKAKNLLYNKGEEYFTNDEGSLNHLINTKRLKK